MDRIMTAHTDYARMIESLAASITLKHKFKKIVARLQSGLSEIEADKTGKLEVVRRQRTLLEEAMAKVRDESEVVNREQQQLTVSRKKVLAWNSHARQAKVRGAFSSIRCS